MRGVRSAVGLALASSLGSLCARAELMRLWLSASTWPECPISRPLGVQAASLLRALSNIGFESQGRGRRKRRRHCRKRQKQIIRRLRHRFAAQHPSDQNRHCCNARLLRNLAVRQSLHIPEHQDLAIVRRQRDGFIEPEKRRRPSVAVRATGGLPAVNHCSGEALLI